MRPITKHFRIIPDYFRLAIKRETEFKAGFYTFILQQAVTVGIWLVFWRALIGRIGDLGEWDFNRMIILTGFATVNMGLWIVFSYIWRLPREILTGELNNHLIKPVHPFIHMIMRRLNLRALPRVGIGIITVIIGFLASDIRFDATAMLLAALVNILSAMTTFLPFALVCISTFWIGRADFLRDLYVELFVFQNYPLSEFPMGFIITFTFFIPLMFTSTLPTMILAGDLGVVESLLIFALMAVIITIQIFAFGYLWNRGLKHYESFGG